MSATLVAWSTAVWLAIATQPRLAGEPDPKAPAAGVAANAEGTDAAWLEAIAASRRGAWDEAADAFALAADRHGGRAPLLDFNWGTACALADRPGCAVLGFRRVLAAPAPAELQARARHNLAKVRQRVAARPAPVVVVMAQWAAQRWVGLAALWAGLCGLGLLVGSRVAPHRAPPGTVATAALLGLLYGVAAGGHLWGLWDQAQHPEGVILGTDPVPYFVTADAPAGAEPAGEFASGTELRVLEIGVDRLRVRSYGSFEGWVPRRAVAPVRPGTLRRRVRVGGTGERPGDLPAAGGES